tara:strand:+ start:155 stop:727 length:573 start_codon:yes stop_codon:yes gene_type:complete
MLLEKSPNSRDLSQDLLTEFFHFHPESGALYNKERARRHFETTRAFKTWNTRWAGKVSGSNTQAGYREVTILSNKYLIHRIVWLLHFGGTIPDTIDHINGVRDDNRLINLRLATDAEQKQNMALYSSSTSGEMGVNWYKSYEKWHARIKIKGKYKHLGYFLIKADAVNARKAAEKKYGFHENHGRKNIYA